MKKFLYKIVLTLVLSISFLTYESYISKTYALSGENKIDLLIENQKTQEIIQSKIEDLDDKLDNNMKQASNNIEVISLSFIPEDKSTELNESIDMELINISDSKEQLEKELQDYIIEGVKLEKSIKEEMNTYLKENNLDFIPALWPVESYKDISSPFGERIHPITNEISLHKGIDIPAPQDTEILSSDNGIVIFSGVQNGYGNVVKIQHFDGKTTVYAHNTKNVVKEGDIVKRGQVIAKVGTTGDSTGNHVHFETIINGEHLNPVNIVSK
ncbi:M23 family peptidase [Romboutsia weinsteinii]|uniref:M23 family peptidase n=1 Tax=Romboutsia weinsteinii TaxID=2020949 RepID=A0A371J888_9FIRM|nr:M23 family metallopeptidase [Romboutsia weinsteinii]RDY28888.1 M23 family peptidase [Romboutsia weinsteinii]